MCVIFVMDVLASGRILIWSVLLGNTNFCKFRWPYQRFATCCGWIVSVGAFVADLQLIQVRHILERVTSQVSNMPW